MRRDPYERHDLTDPDLDGFAARLSPDDAPFAILVEGLCPRCGDWMQRLEPLVLSEGFRDVSAADEQSRARHAAEAVRTAGIDPAQAGGQRDVYVACTCSEAHAGLPEGARGCGAGWMMELTW